MFSANFPYLNAEKNLLLTAVFCFMAFCPISKETMCGTQKFLASWQTKQTSRPVQQANQALSLGPISNLLQISLMEL